MRPTTEQITGVAVIALVLWLLSWGGFLSSEDKKPEKKKESKAVATAKAPATDAKDVEIARLKAQLEEREKTIARHERILEDLRKGLETKTAWSIPATSPMPTDAEQVLRRELVAMEAEIARLEKLVQSQKVGPSQKDLDEARKEIVNILQELNNMERAWEKSVTYRLSPLEFADALARCRAGKVLAQKAATRAEELLR